jgi:hypothetical protein
MNAASRRRFLDAVNALADIAYGGARTGPLGAPRACDCCKKLGAHDKLCAVGTALGALQMIEPAFADRETWARGSS